MGMQILNVVQGSDEWKAIRGTYCVASEAPVIMGDSPFMKRDELLRLKSSGVEREIDEWVEKFIFKRGHEVEALARPIAEQNLGDELYQLTAVNEVDGLRLLASYDGITAPLYDTHWEHKQYNKDLFELVLSGGELEAKHYWQLEHQLLVNGNDSCIFAVSDGTWGVYAEMVYHSRPERRASLIEGWKLFLQDLATYVHREPEVKPAGTVIKDLPALVIDIAGEVKSSNLAIYKTNAMDFVDNIKTVLHTDQDFADADNVVKFCERVEKELDVAKGLILAKASGIDEVMRTIDQLKEAMRQKRLQLSKLIEREKESRKSEILNEARTAWQNHLDELNKALVTVRLPDIKVDFAGAAKGKRTTDTFRSAVNDEFARARIEANRIASHIESNLELLRKIGSDYKFLFADTQQLVLKDGDAVEAIANQRIAQHKLEQQKKIDDEAKRLADEKIAEAERQRLAEELAKQQPAIVQESQNPNPVETTTAAPQSTVEKIAAPGGFGVQGEPARTLEPAAISASPKPTNPNYISATDVQTADPAEFIRGKHLAFKIALDRFRECEKSGANYAEILESLINATKPVATRAA